MVNGENWFSSDTCRWQTTQKKLYKNINRVVENDGCGVIEGDFKCKKQEELDKQQMCDPNFQPTRNKTKI